LVALRTITPIDGSKPSISVRIWLSVCSRSSWPPPKPPIAPARERPIASSSSMKMIAGASALACANRSRTRDAPTPTNISTNSDAEIEKKGTAASPASARASSVLPAPGEPVSSTPRGIRPPTLRYFSGSRRKSTISASSALASSMPAMSSNVTRSADGSTRRARERPNVPIGPPAPAPASRRNSQISSPTISSVGSNPLIRLSISDGPSSGGSALTATPFSRSRSDSSSVSANAGTSVTNRCVGSTPASPGG
jgi:hypothetical protein